MRYSLAAGESHIATFPVQIASSSGVSYQVELLIGGQHVGLVQKGVLNPNAFEAQSLSIDAIFDTTGLDLSAFTVGQTPVTLVISQPLFSSSSLFFDDVRYLSDKALFTGLVIADADSDTLTLTASVTHGVLTRLGSGSGLTVIDGDGTDGTLFGVGFGCGDPERAQYRVRLRRREFGRRNSHHRGQ